MSIRLHSGIGHRGEQGFTLIEAMIVVAIVGILSALAVYGARKYIISSKTSEAMEIIGSIKAAQESYAVDTLTYLDVSGTHSLNDLSSFHPVSGKPVNKKYAWDGYSTNPANKLKALNVNPSGAVYFTYGCAAGGPNDTIADYKTSGVNVTIGNWPAEGAQANNWYVVKAIGDLDGDGVLQQWTAANFTERIFNNLDTE